MNRDTPFFDIEHISDTICLCFVNIPRFVSRFVGDQTPMDFRRKRNVLMNHDGPLGRFFLPPDFDKINDFKVMKKQVEWMAGKVAVKTLASILKLCPESSLLIDAEKSGAPFLPDFPHISISISHSGDYAVAAMDTRGLGLALDIEAIEQGRMKNIMGVAFSEKEISLYKDHEDSTLYLNWTVKEAFLKYIKKGFAEGLKKVEIIDGAVVHRGSPVTDIRIDTRILYTDYAFTLIRSIPK